MVIKLTSDKLQSGHERLSQILNNMKQPEEKKEKPSKPA